MNGGYHQVAHAVLRKRRCYLNREAGSVVAQGSCGEPSTFTQDFITCLWTCRFSSLSHEFFSFAKWYK